ncbi:Murein hydrolase activator NlpD precursor [Serratia fonticola]|uniref:Murein hydrolase activator NlpD n=1 Tax=Serratia fonticola TaxID=47917 RepID=A0A4U9WHS1_SERFO|nr:Murein hydrolase activator NlpD precursor [Serratia fonticola]
MSSLRRVAVCTMLSVWLVGCSDKNSTSAPISSVGGGGAAASANAGGGNASQQGRIVYNRSYNSIPKGSYNGGSSYTVKRGDTLFYIAWITGNDFRDLAQRNNIPQPYSLEVGQTLQLGSGSANGGGGMLAGGNGTVSKPPSTTQIQTATVDSPSTNAYSDNSSKQNVVKCYLHQEPLWQAQPQLLLPHQPLRHPASSTASNSAPVSTWKWPTDGKIIDNFSSSEGGNKASISLVPVGSRLSLPPMAV